MNEHMEADYFGYIDDLRWAAGVPEIKSLLENQRPASIVDAVEQWRALGAGSEITLDISAAYWLLSSLGFCRIGGVALPPDVGSVLEHTLPAQVLVGALHGLLHALEHLTDDARELPERFDDAEPVEDVALCTSIMHQLMQTWAAFIAIDKNYQEYLDAGGSPSGAFGVLMLDVLDAFDRVDEVTQGEEQLQLLSIGTELHLLENWRNMLRGPFKETLPWWLDGALESVAARPFGEPSVPSPRVLVAGPSHGRTSHLRLVVSLSEYSKELAADGYELAIAASDGNKQSVWHKELLAFRGTVVGDDSVRVRLDLGRIDENTQELGVFIVGSPFDKRRYQKVIISFHDGEPDDADFERGVATLSVTQTAIDKIAGLTLVDAAGQVHLVDLDDSVAEVCHESTSNAQKPA